MLIENKTGTYFKYSFEKSFVHSNIIKISFTPPDKLATRNIVPFYILYIFVRYADFINCQIVKLLKSPNGANIACVVLTVVDLIATDEKLEPREELDALRRTPIVVTLNSNN